MSKQIINIGASANDKTGDPLRTAFSKVNQNFTELYNQLAVDSTSVVVGSTPPSTPSEGVLWWDQTGGRLYIYYGSSWVDASPEDGVGDSIDLLAVGQSILPSINVTYDLGSSTKRWRDLYLSGNTIDLGGTLISADGNGGLTVPGGISSASELVFDDGLTIADSVISRRLEQLGEGTLDAIGSKLTLTDNSIAMEAYVDPDGLNNIAYGRVTAGGGQVVLKGAIEDVGGETSSIVTVGGGFTVVSTDGVLTSVFGVDMGGLVLLSNNHYIEPLANDLKIASNGDAIICSNSTDLETTRSWTFDKSGTVTTPLMLPIMFTAVLDNAHRTVGNAIVGDPWQYTVSFVVGPGGIVETQIDNPDWPTNPGYASGDEFEFTEEDHGIPGFAFAVTLNAVSEVPETGFVVLLAVTPPPEYPSTVSSLGAIKLSANTSNWVFDPNGTLHYPDGSFGSTAFIGDATRLYGNVDEDVNVIVSHRTSVSAEAMDGTSGDILIVDTTFVDDIKVVQAGWEINAGTEQAPIWLTVNSASDVGTPFYYHINVPGFDFVSGSTYTFRNPTAISQTWTFNNSTGTLRAPGGALLSSETAVIGEGDAYRDFSIEILNQTGTNEYRWLFDNTAGDLTLPNALKFNDGVSTITALDPAQSGGVGGISLNGKDRAYITINNDAFGYGWDFRAFGLADYSTTAKPAIKFPGNGWLQEDFTDALNDNVPVQLGSQGSITLTTTLNGVSPTEHNWIFGRDGTLTFPDTTVQTTAFTGTATPNNITNSAGPSATMAVGSFTASRDYLTVRVTNNTNTLDVEINYSNPDSQALVSVYRVYPGEGNLYSGKTLKAANNTIWDLVTNLPVDGDSLSFTVTDHSYLKIYRVTVVADTMPGVTAVGEAFCVIEELK